MEPLIRVASNHASGKEAYARSIAIELFEDFLRIEERFAAHKNATEQEVIDAMRLVRSATFSSGNAVIDDLLCESEYEPKLLFKDSSI